MTAFSTHKYERSNPSVCVFCASSDHVAEIYTRTARSLASAMVSQGLTLVYGGGNNGLMGELSAEMYRNNGRIVGVITQELKNLGYAYEGADEMIVTRSMRERKSVMEDLADAFISLPGGFGTLEELLEIITFKQLGLHKKPIVILNVNGFFNNLLRQFETGYKENFIDTDCRDIYFITENVEEGIDYIGNYID
ncbi:MAG: TIGR00730 family Rossman fold protein [Candidatus Latescibacteria bacterium]|nr:TIGR00730 family Rossman fold protein [Candidatus Latescibacterota bacterium]